MQLRLPESPAALEEQPPLHSDKNVVDFYQQSCIKNKSIDLRRHPNERIAAYYAGKSDKRCLMDCENLQITTIKESLSFINYIWDISYIADDNIDIPHMYCLRTLICSKALDGVQSLKDLSLDMALETLSTNHMRNAYNKIQEAVLLLYDSSDGFDLDFWIVDRLKLKPSRICQSKKIRQLHFRSIENKASKACVKHYIKYLIDHTEWSLSTINHSLNTLSLFMNNLEGEIGTITRSDYLSSIDSLKQSYRTKASFDLALTRLNAFFLYLEDVGRIDENPFFTHDKHLTGAYEYKESAVDPYVIDQIFEHLPKIAEREQIYFLLIYETGMRSSEAAQIRKDAAYMISGRCYLKFYSEKMNGKQCTSPIGEQLFRLFCIYRDGVEDTLGNWLFPNVTGTSSLNTTSINLSFKKQLSKYGIVLSDGTPYHFKPHAFRHTIATDLLDSGAAFFDIQNCLNHESIKMTTAYAGVLPKRKKKMLSKRVDIHGKEMPPPVDINASAEWMKDRIRLQILPNGECAKPVEAGRCNHAYNCLECGSFRTDKTFLSIHKDHYKRLCIQADIMKREGYQIEFEHMKRHISSLAIIIEALEK